MLDDLKKIKNRAEKSGKMPKEKMLPFLKLGEKLEGGGVKSLGKKRVKVTGSKIVSGRDYYTKQERKEFALFVEHQGEEYQYRKPLLEQKRDADKKLLPEDERDIHYFVTNLIQSNVGVGDELILEYQRDGKTGFISMEKVGGVDEDDIPVINEEEDASDTSTLNPENIPYPE